MGGPDSSRGAVSTASRPPTDLCPQLFHCLYYPLTYKEEEVKRDRSVVYREASQVSQESHTRPARWGILVRPRWGKRQAPALVVSVCRRCCVWIHLHLPRSATATSVRHASAAVAAVGVVEVINRSATQCTPRRPMCRFGSCFRSSAKRSDMTSPPSCRSKSR